jgi:hypothetical protein
MKVPTETMEMNVCGRPYVFTVRATKFEAIDFEVTNIAPAEWTGPVDLDPVIEQIETAPDIRDQVLIRLNAGTDGK